MKESIISFLFHYVVRFGYKILWWPIPCGLDNIKELQLTGLSWRVTTLVITIRLQWESTLRASPTLWLSANYLRVSLAGFLK